MNQKIDARTAFDSVAREWRESSRRENHPVHIWKFAPTCLAIAQRATADSRDSRATASHLRNGQPTP